MEIDVSLLPDEDKLEISDSSSDVNYIQHELSDRVSGGSISPGLLNEPFSSRVVKRVAKKISKRRRKNSTRYGRSLPRIIVKPLPPQASEAATEWSSNEEKPIANKTPTMREVLASIPGFSYKPRKRSGKKLSTAAQLQQTKEGCIDLETPDSILVNTNLRALLNKHTFSLLPPLYQYKLGQLLPGVDRPGPSCRLSSSSLNNEFFARACLEWQDGLSEGEFTPENQQKIKTETEREKSRLDPWKAKHFEPIWGEKGGGPLPFGERPSLKTTIKLRPTASITSSSTSDLRKSGRCAFPERLRTVGAVTRASSKVEYRADTPPELDSDSSHSAKNAARLPDLLPLSELRTAVDYIDTPVSIDSSLSSKADDTMHSDDVTDPLLLPDLSQDSGGKEEITEREYSDSSQPETDNKIYDDFIVEKSHKRSSSPLFPQNEVKKTKVVDEKCDSKTEEESEASDDKKSSPAADEPSVFSDVNNIYFEMKDYIPKSTFETSSNYEDSDCGDSAAKEELCRFNLGESLKENPDLTFHKDELVVDGNSNHNSLKNCIKDLAIDNDSFNVNSFSPESPQSNIIEESVMIKLENSVHESDNDNLYNVLIDNQSKLDNFEIKSGFLSEKAKSLESEIREVDAKLPADHSSLSTHFHFNEERFKDAESFILESGLTSLNENSSDIQFPEKCHPLENSSFCEGVNAGLSLSPNACSITTDLDHIQNDDSTSAREEESSRSKEEEAGSSPRGSSAGEEGGEERSEGRSEGGDAGGEAGGEQGGAGRPGRGKAKARPRPAAAPPGAVNLERSYQICQAVIQNSPNRDRLRCRLRPPPAPRARPPGPPPLLRRVLHAPAPAPAPDAPLALGALNGLNGLGALNGLNGLNGLAQYVLVQRPHGAPRASSAPPANHNPNSVQVRCRSVGEETISGHSQVMSQSSVQSMAGVHPSRGMGQNLIPNQGQIQGLNQNLIQGMNQNMNQGLNQNMSQGLNQNFSQGPNQSLSQSINQSLSQGLNQSLNQGLNQNFGQGPSQSLSQIPSQSTGQGPCACDLRALVVCQKCGAFCHDHCISPARLCLTCLIR